MQVVLLGATRSGTSVTAGVLSGLGVNLGSDLRPADSHNPRGYFEDRDFLDLNRRILAAAGGDFIHPPSHARVMAQRERFEAEIAALVASRDCAHTLWGWKTTNTCLTLELFLSHLASPRLVMVLRDPLAIARSQLTFTPRQLDLRESLRLVNTYYNRALTTIERHAAVPITFVSYEDLLTDPIGTAGHLTDFLGIGASRDQIRRAAAMVAGRRRRATERGKIKLESWRTLQVARFRSARALVGQHGIGEIADHIRDRARNRNRC